MRVLYERGINDIEKDYARKYGVDISKVHFDTNDLILRVNMSETERLEQNPCEDAISRKAVLNKLNKLIEVERLQGTDEMGYGRERVSAYECMIHSIESKYLYPSVNPQQPCEDCISRQSIKRKLQEHHDFFIHAYGGFSNMSQNDKSRVDEINNCIAMIVNEPPVTPKEKDRWIPVSERLPEEGEEVLVWYRYWRYGEYNNWYYTYGIGYQYADIWGVIAGGTRTTVYAWVPLPQPYKAESEDKE